VVDPDGLARAFEARFARTPRIFRAPGRVNLIGEHTDYNDGFVMPMALDRSTWVAAAPRTDRGIVVRSEVYDETITIDLGTQSSQRRAVHWSDYVRGVATLLESPGADMLIASDVPVGSGLSSSAALEVACASALVDLAGSTMDLSSLARVCQRAEHEFAGMHCGIMDQTIACYGRAGHALMLDTRSLARTFVPLPPAVRVLICNTMVRHELASSEYNLRRADCEAGVAVLRRADASIQALRDATLEQLAGARAALTPRVYARCHHVISENNRVERAAAAMTRGDFHEFGVLMAASHASLRDDYEVSCSELDAMAEIVASLDGVYGARMTGGGFGGCVVALADASKASPDMRATIGERYESRTGRRPDVWVTTAGDGVSAWSAARV
jgi:galactokinase